MGQCTSRKAAGAFAASAAVTHQKKPSAMHKHKKLQESPNDESDNKKKYPPHSKGVAMSFGFKKRPASAHIIGNSNAARRLANADLVDRNGNGETEPLTSNAVPSGRTTPRLPAPKKEPNATRGSRFGFRHPTTNRLNKVSDINPTQPTHIECTNNNDDNAHFKTSIGQPKVIVSSNVTDSNRNTTSALPQPALGRFTLQTAHLPKPQIPIIESKAAKTLANNNRKISATMNPSGDEASSKDGSLTEDSGVGSHTSGNVGECDTLKNIKQLDGSPTFGVRKSKSKPRTLGVVVSGNTFDVKDLEDNSEPDVPIPRLPSAFQPSHPSTGFVRERALQYQRQLDRDKRKISVTSSEGCSDDYGEEEKTYREKYRSEKTFTKTVPQKTFLKARHFKEDSSTTSSDEHEWAHAGEAMADATSCSFSSSDESREKEQSPIPQRNSGIAIVNTNLANLNIGNSAIGNSAMGNSNIANASNLSSALQNLINASLTNSIPKNEIKNVLLTLEDPKFAAIAAASNAGSLLEDETSPTDSLICSYSETEEFMKKKMNGSSSNSKDINEKLTLSPPSPGTPTNASNSLSLSEGRDFLIDDEIADQPALMFDETLTPGNSETFSLAQNSENTPTLIDSTPKPKRRMLGAFEGSPLAFKNKKLFRSRAGSVDTLSPCESIASDDLMMDFDRSQSSGLEDFDRSDRNNGGFSSLDETVLNLDCDKRSSDIMRDWSAILGGVEKISNKSVTRTSRLLRSRTGTPCSVTSIPDSPRSLDSRISNPRTRTASAQSPLRLSRGSYNSPAGYESDDSIKLDRANHGAMVQDIMSIKTMLLKLKRVLHEQADEEILMRSETHNPFEVQKNGLFNGLSSDTESLADPEENTSKIELADLRRQVLFLQGQLEDKERTVQVLQHQMTSIINDHHTSNSAPASTIMTEVSTSNAATQTERIRPISAGPSLLQTSPDGNVGSLVSANESSRRSRLPSAEKTSPHASPNLAKPPSRLWRKPGEPPSPQRYSGTHTSPQISSIPRRSCSRTRAPTTPS